MVLVGLAQIGLLEDERHTQRSLPEIDGALLRRSDDRNVMETLDLNLPHGVLLSDFSRSCRCRTRLWAMAATCARDCRGSKAIYDSASAALPREHPSCLGAL